MQPLTLTEEQIAKLLEMCNALFPEYVGISVHDGTCDLCLEGVVQLKISERWNNWIQFHWFEFIWLHLVSRLQDELHYKLGDEAVWSEQPYYVGNVFGHCEGTRKWTLYTNFFFHYTGNTFKWKQHPIDFLYNEFLKLNNNVKEK